MLQPRPIPQFKFVGKNHDIISTFKKSGKLDWEEVSSGIFFYFSKNHGAKFDEDPDRTLDWLVEMDEYYRPQCEDGEKPSCEFGAHGSDTDHATLWFESTQGIYFFQKTNGLVVQYLVARPYGWYATEMEMMRRLQRNAIPLEIALNPLEHSDEYLKEFGSAALFFAGKAAIAAGDKDRALCLFLESISCNSLSDRQKQKLFAETSYEAALIETDTRRAKKAASDAIRWYEALEDKEGLAKAERLLGSLSINS